MKIGIAATSYGPIYPAAYDNHMRKMVSWSKRFTLCFEHIGGVQQYDALNLITEKLLNDGCTEILYVEHDNLYPDDLLDMLLNAGKSIVSGTYYNRRWPFMPIAAVKKDGNRYNIDLSECDKGNVYEVDTACFGCCLVHREAIESIGPKPFDVTIEGRTYTPDVVFFDKLKRVGHKLYVVAGAECGHLGDPVIVTCANYREMRNLNRQNTKDLPVQKFHTDLSGGGVKSCKLS